MNYDAFISYSHSADRKLAPAIQDAIQRMGKPWYRLRALNVFRDDTNLTAIENLTESIKNALSSARYFVYMASPAAAVSKWVGREIDIWKERKLSGRLIIVLTDGEIFWDDARENFDWEKSTSIHPNLDGFVVKEPIWVDLRAAKKSEHFSPRDPDFQRAISRIAGPMHGKAPYEMLSEDVRQHKNTLLVVRASVGVLVLLLTASTLSTFIATRANEQLRSKIAIMGVIFPVFGVRDTDSAPVADEEPYFKQLLAGIERYLRGPADGEEVIKFGPPTRALAADCSDHSDVDILRACPGSSAAFESDGLRNDVAGLRDMSNAIVKAIVDGTLQRQLRLTQPERSPVSSGPVDPASVEMDEIVEQAASSVIEDAAMVIPYAQRKELSGGALKTMVWLDHKRFIGDPETNPMSGRQLEFVTWKKNMGVAELVALRLVDGYKCGSGGCTNPTIFFLRVEAVIKPVLFDIYGAEFVIYDIGKGKMPQIVTIDMAQNGVNDQGRRMRRYDFDAECTCYKAYMVGEVISSGANSHNSIPQLLK